MNFDIKKEIKIIISNTDVLRKRYFSTHPNTKYSLDTIIQEIIYFLRSGTSWNLLRSSVNSKTLFWHFQQLVKYNIFFRLYQKIKYFYLRKYNPSTTLYIDSTSISNKYGVTKIGRNKFYKNKKITKISLLCDSKGFPLSIYFLKGNKHDNNTFTKHIDDALILIPNKKITIVADKAYSSKSNYQYLNDKNISHIIPPRKNMTIYGTYKYSSIEYKKRIKIEHIFSKLKNYKRLIIRYDKFIPSFSSFTYLAFSLIMIKMINNINF